MRGAFSFSGSTVQTSLTLDTSFSTIGVKGDIHVSTSSGGFHLPNPPPMTAKEKHLAIVRQLEEPPLCEYGDRAVINPENMLEFVSEQARSKWKVYLFKCLSLYVCVY